MTSTLPLFQYCVLFVDANQRDLWMGNLKQAAGDLEIVVWDQSQQPQPADPLKCIVVMHELEMLDRVRVNRFCAIFAGLSQVQSLTGPSGVLTYPTYLPAPVASLYTERHARNAVKDFAFFDLGRMSVPEQVIEQAQQNAVTVDESKLAMFVDGYTGKPKGPIYFAPSDFTFGSGGGLGAHEWIDITGTPRVLVSGPNIYLPKGKWEMVCRFDVDAATVGMPFTVDWGSEKNFETTPLMFDRPGIFELAIQHDWIFPMPAQLRFVMKNSSLGGILGFLGGELSPV